MANANRREQCKKIVDRNDFIKCKWLPETGEFRVTLDGLSAEREEAVAYYTDDYEDAFATAAHMSDRRRFELS